MDKTSGKRDAHGCQGVQIGEGGEGVHGHDSATPESGLSTLPADPANLEEAKAAVRKAAKIEDVITSGPSVVLSITIFDRSKSSLDRVCTARFNG